MHTHSWYRTEPTVNVVIDRRTVVIKTFTMPDTRQATFATFGPEHQHHAAVIALTSENKIIIARQFRVGPEKIMDELPGGTVEEGETPLDAAKRELLEETGYKAGSIVSLGACHKDAYMNATWHFFFATGCRPVGTQTLDDHEHIDIRLITPAKLMTHAKTGRMSDAVAVLMAYERLLHYT